jgi:hypothetical protein
MSANLNGALPSGEANGLAAIARELVDNPNKVRREWERRTGKTVLPFELEEDMRAAFGDDPTGE